MKDGIVRILPALVGKAALCLTMVLDEAVSVAVAVLAYPVQRSLDVGPDCRDGLAISGALQIHSCEHEEEWGGIDRAVIAAEWNLAQIGHLTLAQLMQDFTWLGIGPWIKGGGLRSGERAQHAPRDRWVHPQHQHGRDDTVPAK